MLPSALFTTYKQYKDDTNTIVQWLAANARRCGYDPNETPSSTTKSAKPKGKARKGAAGSQTQQPTGSPATGKQYVVKTREFEPMAKCIAEAQDVKIIIPLAIIKKFKRCISARTDTAKWYELDSAAKDKFDYESHVFFIEVLKRALQILVPVSKLQELENKHFRVPAASSQGPADVEGQANRYAHLEIHDIDEADYEALGDAKDTVPPAKPRFVPEELEAFSEWYFAFACFREDIEHLQDHLTDTWTAYADGEVDLCTAAITTNTAIEMVKKAEEDFLKIKRPDLGSRYNSASLVDVWFAECCIRDDLSDRLMMDRDEKFFVPMAGWDQAKESYLLLHRLVFIYTNGIRPGLVGADRIFALTRPAYYGTYNPELDFDDLEPEEQYEQIAALLNDMLVTLGAITVHQQTPNDDMLLQGISYVQMNQVEPPIWLLFACQNFLNTHFTLGTRSERPFEDVRDFALAAKQTLKAHKAFMRKYPLPMRDDDDEQAVQNTLDDIEQWILQDHIKAILTSGVQMGNTKKRRIWQDNEILRMSPLLCGMWKYCFLIQMQWKGISLVNDTGIVAAAHLYNGLQQNGYLGKTNPMQWDDMEYLLEIHRAEDTFMGKRPVSIEDCTKRFAMVQGVAPETFARRRRGNNYRVLRSRAGSKFLTPSTPVARVLGLKYLQQAPNEEWHLDQLDTLVQLTFAGMKIKCAQWEKYIGTNLKELDLNKLEDKTRFLFLFASEPRSEKDMKKNIYIKAAKRGAKQALMAVDPNTTWIPLLRETLEFLKTDKDREDDERSQKFSDKIVALMAKYGPEMSKWPAPPRDIADEFGLGAPESDDGNESDDDESYSNTEDQGSPPQREKQSWLPFPIEAFTMKPVIDQWESSKTIGLADFIDVVQGALHREYLDIQFDYFAFFRSVMSLLLEIQKELVPIIKPHLHEDAPGRLRDKIEQPDGALLIIPQTAMLMACDPYNAPNLLVIRPWLEVDTRPLAAAAKIMKPWLARHGDDYVIAEEDREVKTYENIISAAPEVHYFDDSDAEKEEGTESKAESSSSSKPKEKKIGWSSSVGMVEGLNAKEMRQIYNAMKNDGPFGSTVAETLARIKGVELTEQDKEGIRERDEIMKSARGNVAPESEASSEDLPDLIASELEHSADEGDDEDHPGSSTSTEKKNKKRKKRAQGKSNPTSQQPQQAQVEDDADP